MKTKEEIVANWLPRYTGIKLIDWGKYILLTNFSGYVQQFAKMHGVEVQGVDKPMMSAHANGMSIINFGMGSAMAATVMDLIKQNQDLQKQLMEIAKEGRNTIINNTTNKIGNYTSGKNHPRKSKI